MRTYILNKATNEKAEVTMCNLNGKKAWITLESNQVICNVDNMPDNIQLVFDTSDDKKEFGKWLMAAYRAKGWKKSKFAAAAGISRGSLLLIESGEIGVAYDTLVRICNVLDISFQYPVTQKIMDDLQKAKTN